MFKLLIVEDEDWVRESLRDTINWKDMGIESVKEACDGEEGLEIAQSFQPDIIITDIRMPCINGLEFIQKIRNNNNNAKVIFISGYSDFDYAQKAIKLGAFDYILKPVEDDKLIKIVLRGLEQIEADKQKEILLKTASRQIKESIPLLKEKFLVNLVNGYYKKEQDILCELSYLGIEYTGTNLICFIIQLDELKLVSEHEIWDTHLYQFVLSNIAKDFINKLGLGEVFYIRPGEVICIVSSDEECGVLTRKVASISNGIRKIVKRIVGNTVTIGLGGACNCFADISISYKEALQAVQYKKYFGNDRIYDMRNMDIQKRRSYYRVYNLETLLNNIKLGNRETAIEGLEEIIKEVSRSNMNIYPIDLKFIYIDIVNSIFKTVLEGNSSIEDFSGLGFHFFEKLNALQSIDEMHVWLKDAITEILNHLEKANDSGKRKIVKKAIEYIENHYMEPISLNDVAGKMFLAAPYFCTIFKYETGESFTKYLTRTRIQNAIELMKEPSTKIYEISEAVGYDNVQYFTKIFKAIKGVTPMQYREKISE